jgi:hypothetical protein
MRLRKSVLVEGGMRFMKGQRGLGWGLSFPNKEYLMGCHGAEGKRELQPLKYPSKVLLSMTNPPHS